MSIIESFQVVHPQAFVAERLVDKLDTQIRGICGFYKYTQDLVCNPLATVVRSDPYTAQKEPSVPKCMFDIGDIVLRIAVVGAVSGMTGLSAKSWNLAYPCKNVCIFLPCSNLRFILG